MSFIKKLVKRLDNTFDGNVTAHADNNCLVLTGELPRWSDVVFAGRLAVRDNPYIGLVNDIVCTGETAAPIRKPTIEDGALEWEEPDVLIIGGGIIGCAIARELSRYKLDVLLVEKEHDVAMQTSGRNDGMIHSGIDLKKGTQKYKFNKLGNPMFEMLCAELGVEFRRSGQYLCFARRIWEPFMFLSLLYWKWLGLKGVKVVKRDQLNVLEPSIN
ncbi:MAG: FAD-dependent oxidoreductase, partial [Oscillospiraceae bacterium]|nr:FAD-dependent oxidoreductase [Oscillospiraceae bacterium]